MFILLCVVAVFVFILILSNDRARDILLLVGLGGFVLLVVVGAIGVAVYVCTSVSFERVAMIFGCLLLYIPIMVYVAYADKKKAIGAVALPSVDPIVETSVQQMEAVVINKSIKERWTVEGKLGCPECLYEFKVEDDRLPEKGTEFSCPKCLCQFFVNPNVGYCIVVSSSEVKPSTH